MKKYTKPTIDVIELDPEAALLMTQSNSLGVDPSDANVVKEGYAPSRRGNRWGEYGE